MNERAKRNPGKSSMNFSQGLFKVTSAEVPSDAIWIAQYEGRGTVQGS